MNEHVRRVVLPAGVVLLVVASAAGLWFSALGALVLLVAAAGLGPES